MRSYTCADCDPDHPMLQSSGPAWQAVGPATDPAAKLWSPYHSIAGTTLHLMALATGPNPTLQTGAPSVTDEFEALERLTSADGHFQITIIAGRAYIVCGVPPGR